MDGPTLMVSYTVTMQQTKALKGAETVTLKGWTKNKLDIYTNTTMNVFEADTGWTPTNETAVGG